MHVVIPVLPAQAEQATRLLERIADLGGVSQFPALIISAGEIDLAPLHKLASSAFQRVTLLPIEIPDGHPRPENVLFVRAAFHMGNTVGDAYLYLEPDSWPTGTPWLKDLVTVYREHNHRFMGKLALLTDGTGESYMLPTGIYPKDFYAKSDLIRQVPLDKPVAEFLQGEIVYRGKAHDSGLFVVGMEDERNAALVIHYHDADDLDDEGRAPHEAGYTGPSEYISVKRDRATLAAKAALQSGADQMADHLGQPRRAVGDEMRAPQGSIFPRAVAFMKGLPLQATVASAQTYEAYDKLAADAVSPDASWPTNPQAFDPNIAVPVPMQDPGHLPSYPQPVPSVETVTEGGITHVVAPEPVESVEKYATEAERNIAVKKAQAGGMPWREMMSTFKLTPKVLKSVLNQV